MNKKSFFILLILSFVTTIFVSLADSIINETFIAGASGFPFKYSKGTLFGNGTIDYLLLILDIIFWFIILWSGWKIISLRFGREGRQRRK